MGREEFIALRRPGAAGPATAGDEARVAAGVEARDEVRGKAADEAALAEALQTAMASWCARQREAMEAMTALMHALVLSQDPVRTAETWIDWRKDALRRLIEDARDQMAVAAALARCFGDTRLFPEDASSGDEALAPAAATPARRAPDGLRPDDPAGHETAASDTRARRTNPFRSKTGP